MKIPYLLLIGASVAFVSCKDKEGTVEQADAAVAKKKGSALSGLSPASADETKPAEGKSADRPKITKKPAVAEPAAGQPGKVISPNTGELVDVSGRNPGDIVEDPKYPGDASKEFEVPKDVEKHEIPVARAVPGKPGFVISPYNNKVIDVTGMPAGALVADPTYPSSEKKHLRIPPASPEAEPSANGSGAPGAPEGGASESE